MGNTAQYDLDTGNWSFNVLGAQFSYVKGHWSFQGYNGQVIGFGYNSHTGFGVTSQTLDRIGKVWASPATALGLVFGTTLAVIDLFDGGDLPYISYQYNALNFITNMSEVPLFDTLAITLGNVVVYGDNGKGTNEMNFRYDRTGRIHIGLHEKAHTLQWQLLGLGFLALYFGTGGWTKPSFMEHTADNYSEFGGWWLW